MGKYIEVFNIWAKAVLMVSILLILSAFVLWWVLGFSFTSLDTQIVLFVASFALAVIGTLIAMRASIKIDL